MICWKCGKEFVQGHGNQTQCLDCQTYVCLTCGKTFNCKVKRKFCSQSCAVSDRNKRRHAFGSDNPNWKGGTKKTWKKDHPKRVKVHSLISEELRRGRLQPKACENCGVSPRDATIQAHHHDYDKPFDIIWLCASCHANVHFALRESRKESA